MGGGGGGGVLKLNRRHRNLSDKINDMLVFLNLKGDMGLKVDSVK